jgi:hypothetical protein
MSTATLDRKTASTGRKVASKAGTGRVNEIRSPYWQGIVQWAGVKKAPRSFVCEHAHREQTSAMVCAMKEVRALTKIGEAPIIELSAFPRYQEP